MIPTILKAIINLILLAYVKRSNAKSYIKKIVFIWYILNNIQQFN